MRIAKTSPHDATIDAVVAKEKGIVGETSRMLVGLVRANIPKRTEAFHRGAPFFCVDDEAFCYVAAHSQHVNLGFPQGAHLDDPEGLLEGTGKGMRHVKVRSPTAIPKAKLVRLIKAAAARAKESR